MLAPYAFRPIADRRNISGPKEVCCVSDAPEVVHIDRLPQGGGGFEYFGNRFPETPPICFH